MKPTHYLNVGTGLIILILGALVAMSWFASNRVSQQHFGYLQRQAELQDLESMRTAVHRIVSSTNEFALIALSKSAGKNPTDSTEAVQPDDGLSSALERERELISGATKEFENALASFSVHRESSNPGSDSARFLDTAFHELLELNDGLLQAISATVIDSDAVFELKEEQEDLETKLLGRIVDDQMNMQAIIQASGGILAEDIAQMKNLSWIAGLVAAIILLASTVFISRRIGGMFAEISDQRLKIEDANRDLNTAMTAMRGLQDDLVKREKFATLGRLTATVSHELRNPLSAIRNSSFIIRQGTANLPELSEFAIRIERNVMRCDHIIGDLLEYTRVRDLEREPVDLCAWLERYAQEQDLPQDVSLVLNLASEPVFANVDENRFRRVIVNLVENASQAIEAAGKPGVIQIICQKHSNGITLTVADDGPGMPAETARKIFEPLFTTKNFGAGLGLSIVQNIVTQHGGTITVKSQEGKGTAFSINLPENVSIEEKSVAA